MTTKRSALVFVAALLSVLASAPAVLAHCEIPCGIYGDAMRIELLSEHADTIEKSMKRIEALGKADSINYNQLVRWIDNKEKHCEEFQDIVAQYFMHQRIAPASASDEKAHDAYVKKLTTLHRMLVHAMKAKQTTDLDHVEALRSLIAEFSAMYFSKEDLEHLRQHREMP